MGVQENSDISDILSSQASDENFAPEVHKAGLNTVTNVLRTLYAREGILGILLREKLNPANEIETLNHVRGELQKKYQSDLSDDIAA